jgi:hypothetical protein
MIQFLALVIHKKLATLLLALGRHPSLPNVTEMTLSKGKSVRIRRGRAAVWDVFAVDHNATAPNY